MIRLGGGAIGGRAGREAKWECPTSFTCDFAGFLGTPCVVLSCRVTESVVEDNKDCPNREDDVG